MIRKIEISFPFPVEPSSCFYQRLLELIDRDICHEYERKHPDRVMWPAGYGSKLIWNEPEEPTCDDEIFEMTISERENYKTPDTEELQDFYEEDEEGFFHKPCGTCRHRLKNLHDDTCPCLKCKYYIR